jgi:hypothetical protein
VYRGHAVMYIQKLMYRCPDCGVHKLVDSFNDWGVEELVYWWWLCDVQELVFTL